MAVLEPQILKSPQGSPLIPGRDLDGGGVHNQIGLGIGWEFMLSGSSTPGDLDVKHTLAHGGHVQQPLNLPFQFVPLHGKPDLGQCAAAVQPVQMELQGKGLPVQHQDRIIHRVTVKHAAVAKRDLHGIQIPDLSVEITDSFHRKTSRLFLLLWHRWKEKARDFLVGQNQGFRPHPPPTVFCVAALFFYFSEDTGNSIPFTSSAGNI